MNVLLLSAGLGTRLAPFTELLPKCLMPVHGYPLLQYWLGSMKVLGAEKVAINVHYQAGKVRQFLDGFQESFEIAVLEEEELLGTGGTLLKAQEFFESGPALLVHADNLCHSDFEAFLKAHEARPDGVEITMMTFRTPTPESCGIVELDGEQRIQAFHEKVPNPPGNLANAAVYIVEPSVVRWMQSLEQEVIDFSTEVLPHYLGRMVSFLNEDYHRDIGTPQSWLQAQCDFPHQMPELLQSKKAWGAALETMGASFYLDQMKEHLQSYQKSMGENVLFYEGSESCEELEILDAVKQAGGVEKTLVAFDKASPRFSSFDYLKRLGIRTLALS